MVRTRRGNVISRNIYSLATKSRGQPRSRSPTECRTSRVVLQEKHSAWCIDQMPYKLLTPENQQMTEHTLSGRLIC